ncbi:hypothetical protein KL86CLO1_11774 [uncultured Eubacteriales bacterium]|uniref:Uncharacterized protein n=1 Tax=uncultured Eubacteriales bacterium TaxID=172733 RepID=A0A212JVB9_9FIRM|nr:hypothetical protein KL86CLO1_11774 [uncultured Eubacteriales bacterium]
MLYVDRVQLLYHCKDLRVVGALKCSNFHIARPPFARTNFIQKRPLSLWTEGVKNAVPPLVRPLLAEKGLVECQHTPTR